MRLLLAFCALFPFIGLAQTSINGLVLSQQGEPIVGALIYWGSNNEQNAQSDGAGAFSLVYTKPDTLHTRILGYQAVSFWVDDPTFLQRITLTEETLGTVEVKGKRSDLAISTLSNTSVESIGDGELRKAPCCNLSEAFETNAAVDVSYTDAVTGAKEIQLLGLRGPYTLMQIEGRPALYGLGAPYALEYIPGSWLRGIQISKGSGSALSGYQTIAGQINTSLLRPDDGPKVFLNIFGNEFGRIEGDVHLRRKIKKNQTHALFLHANRFNRFMDHNHDGFADMPLKKQLNGLYRWRNDLPKWCLEANLQALSEARSNGIGDHVHAEHPFIVQIDTRRAEAFGKAGYTGFVEPYRSAGVQWSLLYHNAQGRYGIRSYSGRQLSAYVNAMYSTIIGTSDHKLTYGVSLQADDYQEQLSLKDLSRRDIVPGLLGEYTFDHFDKKGINNWTIVSGMRLDLHNRFGLLATPRLHIRYNPKEHTALRLAIGRGMRSPNLVVDNMGMLASNRVIHWPTQSGAEDAWSLGLNLTRSFTFLTRPSSFNMDLNYTHFTWQIVPNYDIAPNEIYLEYLKNSARSAAALATWQFFLIEGVSVRNSYKYTQPTQKLGDLGWVAAPLQPNHRWLSTVTWRSPNEKWMVNGSSQWTGSQRLPSHAGLPERYANFLPETAKPFWFFMAQAGYFAEKWEVYLGSENLGNLTQKNTIVAFDDPSSQWFDASQVYAPTMQRTVYAGMRFRFK
jgi:outer membrane receptor for ferrienterochelin and colicins